MTKKKRSDILKKLKSAAIMAAVMITLSTAADFSAFSGRSTSDSYAVNAYAAEYTKDINGFITRMFNVCIDSEPSEKALTNWEKLTGLNLASGTAIVTTFFYSDEYKAVKHTNEEIAEDCYMAILGRLPDSSQKEKLAKQLEIGMTLDSVLKALAGSAEFKNYCTSIGIQAGNIQLKTVRDENFERTYFVYRLYNNCLGRKPDIAGLESWCKTIKSGYTGAKTVNGFVNSAEYKKRNTSNTEFVTMLYKTLLGRNPDPTGLSKWAAALDGGKSRNAVINGFLFSNEFKAQCAKAGIVVGTKLPE